MAEESLLRYEQHPDEVTDYPCTWRLKNGVTVASVVSTIDPVGPTVVGSTPADNMSQTRVSSVVAGTLYQIEEVVTFTNGEVKVEEFEVLGVDRASSL